MRTFWQDAWEKLTVKLANLAAQLLLSSKTRAVDGSKSHVRVFSLSSLYRMHLNSAVTAHGYCPHHTGDRPRSPPARHEEWQQRPSWARELLLSVHSMLVPHDSMKFHVTQDSEMHRSAAHHEAVLAQHCCHHHTQSRPSSQQNHFL